MTHVPNQQFPSNLNTETARERLLNPNTRKDVILFLAVENSMSSMDPDTKAPRMMADGRGYMRSPWFKRMVRDAWAEFYGKPLFIERGADLTQQQTNEDGKARTVAEVQERFIDALLFGYVPTQDKGASGCRGPVQIHQIISMDPVLPIDDSITRVAGQIKADGGMEHNMGRSAGIDFGLFRVHMSYSAADGSKLGITEEHLKMLFDAALDCFDRARSSMRSHCRLVGGYAYDHGDRFGGGMNAQDCLDDIQVVLAPDKDRPTGLDDYTFSVANDVLPGKMTRIFLPPSRMGQVKLLGDVNRLDVN